mmetsp:Transcript_130445/g.260279  ORF Transcript_130445/g.260279 Transcript_130445/m.260279 type:complete len:227 (+) Transcript_130445:84-764(+)|eukprot:CAMPEP_0172830370 /NCGR_PEP_ID=MMETSP1075-20121228/22209_1 /TAXON_ID=2916 /ORGANISM="Ceratium fusus, Strain PA161109" /LENGTH=226 /DNA_ID=CAMNT_0013672655 /DNA_START=43 /DNA_END=720 /DNA_ORIENTATION=-
MAVGSKFSGFLVAAAYDFPPTPSCLSFDVGDRLEILRWNKFGWWWGCCTSTGKQGWIPSTHVQPVAPLALAASAPGLLQPPDVPQLPQPQDVIDAAVKPNPAEVWPPLPPGLPPSSCNSTAPVEQRPPLPPTPALHPAAASCGGAAASSHASVEVAEEYDQSLGILPNGRASTGRNPDHGLRQLSYFFNMEQWTEQRNRQERMRCKPPSPVRLTGDGGFKRRRRGV